MNFRLGELFCGPGGIALGAISATANGPAEEFSISHAWATDYDSDTCNTYRDNICPDSRNSVICKDIRQLQTETLESISNIDALAFGFPCNDFSVVGEQKGIDGVYGPLYRYAIDVLEHFRPSWFLAENVGGLRNSNEGRAFRQILFELTEAGYTPVPHLYKFEQYGVPQARHRIIIIGIRSDLSTVFRVPAPPDVIWDNTCKTAILSPPIPPDASNHELTRQSPSVVERLGYIKPGQNAFTADLPKHLELNVKGVKMSHIYRRLDPTRPAYTITGSGGGGTYVYHWEENRALTNRERARLQTFPDKFVFSGSPQSVRKQIGMAVPPKGAQIICQAVLRSFAGIEYPSITPNISLEETSALF